MLKRNGGDGSAREAAPSAADTVEGAAGRSRGFALLAVIWVLALLVILFAAVAADTNGGVRLARNRVGLAQARALAEAGVTLAAYSMLDGTLATEWRADGTVHELDYGGGHLAVALQDENGKIDLNAAPPELIEGLCNALGIGSGAALAQAVVARRTAFAATAPPAALRFAPPPGVARLGRGGAAELDMRRMPFAAVDELYQVAGVTPESYRRLRPFVTVQSGSARIDPQTAPREVLLALPGVSPQEVGFLLAARAASRAPGAALPTLSGVERYVAPGNLHAVAIEARAVAASGARFVREAVVIVTGTPLHPFRYADWRRGEESAPAAQE